MKIFRRKGIRGMTTLRDSKGVTRLYLFTRTKVLEYDPDKEVWRTVSSTVAKEIKS